LEAKRHVYQRNESWWRWLWADPYNGVNVYATISATTETDESVVLGAHYDSIVSEIPADPTAAEMPGANDNASGVALVYSVARALRQVKPRRKNVIVVFFDQEEQGLIGSRAFVEKLKEERVNVHSAHTVDQIGWDSDGDRAIELESPPSTLESLYRKTAEQMDVPVHVTSVSATDHEAFREQGFEAVGITEEYQHGDTTPHIHQLGDTYKTIDFTYLASATCLVTNALRRLVQPSHDR
jgi:Zn-dependent M28 family amino/carboxypeptidase